MGMEQINAMNDKIHALHQNIVEKKQVGGKPKDDQDKDPAQKDTDNNPCEPEKPDVPSHKGRVLFDATACPQDIAYPTDIDLLSSSREKTQELIDILYDPALHHKKPRTYRKVARKDYLNIAQNW
jgi:transposase, IS5 family